MTSIRNGTELLARTIAPEPAAQVRDGGVIASGYDAELDELRAIDDHCGEFLVALEARERERTGIVNLKVEYNRVHGFYIEVTNANALKVPDDYRRRQTLKNAERYITPELKAFEDKALSAQERALAREKVLYDALLVALAPAIPALQSAATALATLDALATFAERAEALDLTRPSFVPATGISIRGGRHPVVERQVDEFIPNDLELRPERRLLIITGPNMGGKSTYMRQTAVIALLAYCGSFVPAKSAEIGPLDAIHTRIGAADDLAGGRSTFMVEMTEAATILHRATPQSLVLIDEIGRGTSTFDGLALAWAIAHQLAEKNRSLALFATHYFELTALPAEIDGCANLHFDAVEHANGIVFLHAAEDGPANRSYGIQVAKLAGVPAEAIRRAKGYLARLDKFNAGATAQADLFAPIGVTTGDPEPFPDSADRCRHDRDAPRIPRPGCDDAARRAGGALRAEQNSGSVIYRWHDNANPAEAFADAWWPARRGIPERAASADGTQSSRPAQQLYNSVSDDARHRRAHARARLPRRSRRGRRGSGNRSADACPPTDDCRRARPCRRRCRSP